MRKMATIERVQETRPIPKADRLEAVRVRQWWVVVPKGEYHVGDQVYYFEIDSALPISDPRFSHLSKFGTKKLGDGTEVHVLRTIRLRGQLSQGLVVKADDEVLPIGTDVSKKLGITKWEPPITGGSEVIGSFPSHLASKTDSERVQNLTEADWGELHQFFWYATSKLDGTSCTAWLDEDTQELRVASRNNEVGKDSLHYKAVISTGLAKDLEPGYVVQGEIVGPGIQGNPLKLNEVQVFLFSVWKDREIVSLWPEWAAQREVPILDISFPDTIEEAIAQAYGRPSPLNGNVESEGIVWHTVRGVPHCLKRNTFKVINNKYLEAS